MIAPNVVRTAHKSQRSASAGPDKQICASPGDARTAPSTRPRCPHPSIVRIGENAPLPHSLDRLQYRFAHGVKGGGLPLRSEGGEVFSEDRARVYLCSPGAIGIPPPLRIARPLEDLNRKSVCSGNAAQVRGGWCSCEPHALAAMITRCPSAPAVSALRSDGRDHRSPRDWVVPFPETPTHRPTGQTSSRRS